jgi:PAS domain S-box-containing protein
MTDENGLIRSANAAAAGMLGVRLDRLMRKPLFVYVSEEDRPVIRRMLARAVEEEAHELRMIASLLVRGGETVSAELAATLERDTERPDGGLQVTWLLIAHTGIPGAGERRDSARLAQALAGITQLPMHTASIQQTLTEISGLCQQAFTSSVAVSVTLGDPLSPELVATDSKLAQSLDGAQIMAGEGPCQDAWEQAATVSAAYLSTDPRWPGWRRHYESDTTVRSCIATPIRVADRVVGVINIYSPTPGLPSGSALEAAELLSTSVAAILHEVDLRTELEGVAKQLQTALESRATIDQAKGIIMARHGCTADEAFRVLADASSRANVKLRVIAKRLVDETAHRAT